MMRGGKVPRSLSRTTRAPRDVARTFFGIFFPGVFLPLFLVLALVGGTTRDAAASPSHLVVRGVARIDAHVARSHGKVVLRGTVTDDRGAPTAGVRIALQLIREGRGALSLAAFGTGSPEACGDVGTAPQAPVLEGPDRIVLVTDAAARFCVRLAVPTDRYIAHLEARASGLIDGAQIDVPVDLALATVTLRFDPEPPLLSLSLDDAATTLDVLASMEDDGVAAPTDALPLHLSNEAGTPLGEARTDPSGRARFVVPSARLGPAGKGELRVSFAGSAEIGARSYAIEIERRTRVQIDVPDAVLGTLPPGSPESGIVLRVVATAACLSRGCAGSPSGTVEVRLGGAGDANGGMIAAAPLEKGEARVLATFPNPESPGQVPLTLRYLPDAPWFQPLPPLSLLQPVRPPGPWGRIALAAAGLLVVAWLAIGRLSQISRGDGRARFAPPGGRADEARASIEVVRADRSQPGRWTGRVLDAHDGGPVAATRLIVERPGFESATVVAETTANADGAFVLLADDVRPGDRLVVEGPLHAPARMPMPHTGELHVALVARKRALLDRLVKWARLRGRPFDARPEPTPGHVRRAARLAGRGEEGEGGAGASEKDIKEWAEAVERAAYGGGTIDAAAEAEVDRLAPKGGRR